MVKAMISQEYTYAYTALTPADGRMDSLVLPFVNGICMDIFLKEIASRYSGERIIMIVDGAGWHKNQKLPLPSNLRLVFLPPYAPELNPVEHIWDDLREKFFHNRVFDSIDALEDHLVSALLAYENDSGRVRSITGWDWIINSL
jgi:transposase